MNSGKTKLLAVMGIAGIVTLLSACSSEPSPWAKRQSPWDQRRESMQAPPADEYKNDLGAVDQGMSEVDLSYQTEPVDAYAPGAEEPPAMESADMAAVEPEPEPEPIAPVVQETDGNIMNVPGNYYTIQLIASVDVDRVYKFAEQNQLSVRYVVPTQRDGVTWHVLLLDVYPDKQAARAAMNEVAGTLPTKPWMRKVASVQKLVQ